MTANARQNKSNGSKRLCLADLAEAKKLPLAFLQELGIKDLPGGGIGIPYYDCAGNALFIRERESPLHDSKFWQPAGVKLQAYGQWRLQEAIKASFLIVPEGESDPWTLWYHGFPALGLPGSNTAKALAREQIEADLRVFIIREPGDGGIAFVKGVAGRLAALGFIGEALMLSMPDGLKDPSDLHVQDPANFKERLRAAMSIAVPIDLPRTQEGNGDTHQTAAGGERQPGRDSVEASIGLPRIDAGNEDLASVTGQAWEALLKANEPPTLFRHGAKPSRIEADDEGVPIVSALNIDRMRHQLARVAHWEKTVVRKGGKKGETVIAAASPPLSVVRDVMATPDMELPILTRIVEAPVYAPDGTLQTIPGYCPAGRVFYAPAPGFEVPIISPSPSATAVEEARKLILDELLYDFPFVGDAEKAHTVSSMLLPHVRDMITGPTPLHGFEASTPGTGKTLMVEKTTYPFLGRPATSTTECRDEDDWRKKILSKLRGGPSILLIDNIKRRLESGALASAITAYPLWEDRLLGVSEIVRVPVRCSWLFTGNNPALSHEMIRRTVRIRLDAKVDRPWLRTGFRHANLGQWVEEHRAELVGAILTLIQNWIAAGRPPGEKALGMFESWSATIGGILKLAGIPGFLGNLEEFYDRADSDTATWAGFVAAWWDMHRDNEMKAGELFSLAIEFGVELHGKTEQAQKVKLGQLLREMRDRVFCIGEIGQEQRLRLEAAGKSKRAMLWRLQESR